MLISFLAVSLARAIILGVTALMIPKQPESRRQYPGVWSIEVVSSPGFVR
jgi:hypothetical protein